MSLKQKTINGLIWSFIDNFANQGIRFIVGIILARLLTPREFGLIGMITVFIAISQSLIDSGFSQALIRKKDCTQADYSTVFYFNILIGFLLYVIIFLTAGSISVFYREPQLQQILQVLGICLVINALNIIQRARLIKQINFKLQTRISVIASVGSGIIGIVLAINGFGVWSLVYKTIADYTLRSALLWLWNKWTPSFLFNLKSFREMFMFGSKLMVSGLIDTTYKNVYYLIIGKYFTAVELGYYTRADQFQSLPSSNITGVIQNVSFPVLASIQDDKPRLKSGYKMLIKCSMLISFVVLISLAAIARPLVLTLIGSKWLPSVTYLQMLCFIGMLYPLHAINLNMLSVLGRSDLFLRLEIIKKTLAVPTIIIGIIFGIKIMILGMFVTNLFGYYLNSYWSGKFIGYSIFEQIKDIGPSLILGLSVGVLIFIIGLIPVHPNFLLLCIQILAGIAFTIAFAELFKMDNYIYIKNIISEKLSKKTGKSNDE